MSGRGLDVQVYRPEERSGSEKGGGGRQPRESHESGKLGTLKS